MVSLRTRALGLVAFIGLASALFGEQRDETGSIWGECYRRPIECFTHRGRLSGQNGIAHMIWLIGTKRIVAVDNEMPEMF